MKSSLILLLMCIHVTSYAMENSTQEKSKQQLVLLFLKVLPAENRFLFFPITEQTVLREVIEHLHSHFVSGVPLSTANYIITPQEAHKSVKTFNLERWGSKKMFPIIKLCKSNIFFVEQLNQNNSYTNKTTPKVPSLNLSKLPDKTIGKR